MTKEERLKLNEKLAKRFGLGCLHQWVYIEGKTPLWGMDCLICKQEFRKSQWSDALAPRIGDLKEIPNFTDSLDTCIKWLIPKLDKCSISTNKALGINVDCPNRFTVEVMMDKSYRTKGGFLVRNELWARIRDDSAALALCLAVESLTDKEV